MGFSTCDARRPRGAWASRGVCGIAGSVSRIGGTVNTIGNCERDAAVPMPACFLAAGAARLLAPLPPSPLVGCLHLLTRRNGRWAGGRYRLAPTAILTVVTGHSREALMRLDTGWSDFGSGGRTCAAFRARPAATRERLPGVLLIQEIWGVDRPRRGPCRPFPPRRARWPGTRPVLARRPAGPRGCKPSRVAAVKAFLNSLPVGTWWDETARQEALAGLPARPARGRRRVARRPLRAPRPGRTGRSAARRVAALRDDPACPGGWLPWVGAWRRPLGPAACAEPTLAGAAIFYGEPAPAELVSQIAYPLIEFVRRGRSRITAPCRPSPRR